MNPVCVNCARGMDVEKNGVFYYERDHVTNKYIYVWSADMYKCRNCGNKILSGFGHSPLKFNPTEDELKKDLSKGHKVVYK